MRSKGIRQRVPGLRGVVEPAAVDHNSKTIPLGSAALTETIAAFRCGLNLDELDRQIEAMKSTGKQELFDLALANELYTSVLGPIEALTKDKKQLIIVPSGAPTALRFHLLVTQKPAGAAPARPIVMPRG